MVCLATAGSAFAQEMQIQFAEPVVISSGAGHVEFTAYGRHFGLDLSSNSRLLAKLPAARKQALDTYKILRGVVTGQSGSWVRITEFDGRNEGAIWDGHDFYAVTSYGRIAPFLSTPLAADPRTTVIYRLSDTINLFPKNFCADGPVAGTRSRDGLTQYRKLVQELSKDVTENATLPLELDISLIGDADFQTKFGSNAVIELLARHNIVDGIYAEQLGLLVNPTDVRVVAPDPNTFTSTDPSTLLGQVAAFRRGDAVSNARGVTHLVTGHSLDGTTAGIAYRGGACDINQGASLSEASLATSFDGLVMAHELGHNLGAVHDGEGVCASTPSSTYLMAPVLSYNSQFSQCSLDTIRPFIQSASCIKPANYADVELPPAAAEITVELDTPLILPYAVRSTGMQTAHNVHLKATPPAELSITGTDQPQWCTVTSNVLDCAIGDMAPGAENDIHVSLLPSVASNFTVNADVSADDNPSTHNDTQQQPVRVIPNADASVSVVSPTGNILLGDNLDFEVDVLSLRSHAVRNVQLVLDHSLLNITSVDMPSGGCTIGTFRTTCVLGDLNGGTSTRLIVHAKGSVVGADQVNARISSTNDADGNNDFARFNLSVNSVHDVGIDAVTPNETSPLNQPYEFDANLHSYGAQSIGGVTLNIDVSAPGFGPAGIDSVTVGGVGCAAQNESQYRCAVGTLAAGEIRPVVIRGNGVRLGTFAFTLNANGTSDDNPNDNQLSRGVTIKNVVDVETLSRPPFTVVEGLEANSDILFRSNGSDAVATTALDLTVPAQLRFTRPFVSFGTATCAIQTPQHIHCTGSFAANSGAAIDITYFLVGDVPGNYLLTATATTAGDEVTSNDSQTVSITVAPSVDVGVRDFTGPSLLVVGTDYPVPVTLFTGSNPVDGVSAIIAVGSGVAMNSVTPSIGTCARRDASSFTCDLGNLPGSATVTLTAVLAAAETTPSALFSVNVSAPGDNNNTDNIRSITFATTEPGDLSVAAASATASATSGTTFAFPRLTFRHTGPVANGALEITLPSGLTFANISTVGMICSGTSVLQCSLPNWAEGTDFFVDINLNANAAGTFNVPVRVTSDNDSSAGNNDATVTVAVAAPQTPPPPPTSGGGGSSSGGGGGGGGRMEWLGLALLGLMVVRRGRNAVLRHATKAHD